MILTGHNDHTNEPSHHIPYLYALAGAPWKGQVRIRSIAAADYNATANGLAGVWDPLLSSFFASHKIPQNEDCGQMSAWWLFSALGFYPVNPASTSYVVGSPFFEKVTIAFPGTRRRLVIRAPGASTKPYVRSLTVNGKSVGTPVLRHEQIVGGGEMFFEMSATPQSWGSGDAMLHQEL